MRAAITPLRVPASRLKKYTPGLSSRTTYVRTFNSGNVDTPGNAGTNRGLRQDNRNGVITIQASFSKVSMGSSGGTSDRTALIGTGQCANSSLFQVCFMIHGPAGRGNGRWAVTFSRTSAGSFIHGRKQN